MALCPLFGVARHFFFKPSSSERGIFFSFDRRCGGAELFPPMLAGLNCPTGGTMIPHPSYPSLASCFRRIGTSLFVSKVEITFYHRGEQPDVRITNSPTKWIEKEDHQLSFGKYSNIVHYYWSRIHRETGGLHIENSFILVVAVVHSARFASVGCP